LRQQTTPLHFSQSGAETENTTMPGAPFMRGCIAHGWVIVCGSKRHGGSRGLQAPECEAVWGNGLQPRAFPSPRICPGGPFMRGYIAHGWGIVCVSKRHGGSRGLQAPECEAVWEKGLQPRAFPSPRICRVAHSCAVASRMGEVSFAAANDREGAGAFRPLMRGRLGEGASATGLSFTSDRHHRNKRQRRVAYQPRPKAQVCGPPLSEG